MSVPAAAETTARIGSSAKARVMQEMCKRIGRVAPQDVNVLILGESGTGKELVARALYQHSRRAAQPFLAINCAAIPDALLESELFGHEVGAFTGASRRHIGKFEQCQGGTLFLDEIGDMPPPLQAKILRVLQDQRFERVGGTETLYAQVRILAATNQDLPRLVADGRFRKDLYYRLNAVTILVPALRDRKEDVAELAHYFLFRFNRDLGLDYRAFAPDTVDALLKHSWPGNVRELQGVIKHAMLNGSGHLILPEFLPEPLLGTPPGPPTPPAPAAAFDLTSLIDAALKTGTARLHDEAIAAVERVLFARVLAHTRGNQTQACEILGLSRATLRLKLRSLGLAVDKFVVDDIPTGKK